MWTLVLVSLAGCGADPGEEPTAGFDPCAAAEVCNGVDDDCNGQVDEGVAIVAYLDRDGDQHGDPGSSVSVCALVAGVSAGSDDCDDADSGVHPDADERCDGRDQDCDGVPDDGLPEVDGWVDADQDGAGDPARPTRGCGLPPDGVANAEDCDDGDAAVGPNAVESCNGRDDDCDGDPDEELLVARWVDGDGDGWGNDDAAADVCPELAGFADRPGDCDDGDPDRNPDATEVCDGRDDDCDGSIDQGVDELLHRDLDLDGFGDPVVTLRTCGGLPGWVDDATDCNDVDAAAFPGNLETCDTVDNDCDAAVDEDLPTRWYVDADGDGLGNPAVAIDVCDPPAGFVTVDGDCDDSDAAVPPSCPASLYGDWPSFGYDAGRTGRVPGSVGEVPPSFAWTVSAAVGYNAGVVVADGRVYSTETIAGEWAFVARDLFDGATAWTSRTFGWGTLSGPTFADGAVCATYGNFSESQVACIDAATGDERWSTLMPMQFETYLAPLVVDGTLYSGGGTFGGLYAHDLATGDEVFADLYLPQVQEWGAAAYDGVVYTWIDEVLIGHDGATGVHVSELDLGSWDFLWYNWPVVSDDGVALLRTSAQLRGVDLATQTQLWTSTEVPLGGVATADGVVYYVRSDGVGRSRDLYTGAPIRTFAGDSELANTPILADDAVLFSSATDTYAYDRATGALLQHFPAGGSPVVADNHLVLVDASAQTITAWAW
ncbi:MAG: MopE-related protein [Myxococcota bacterium]